MSFEWPPKTKPPPDDEPDLERFWRRLGHRKEPPKPIGFTTTALPPELFSGMLQASLGDLINPVPVVVPGNISIQLATNIPPNIPQVVGDRMVASYMTTHLPDVVRVNYVFPGLSQQALVIGLAVWDVGQASPFYIALPAPIHLFVGQLYQLDVSFVLPSLRRRAFLEIPHTDPEPNP